MSQHWDRFDSFVERFLIDGRSFLRWAQDNDVDRYEAAEAAGLLKKGEGRVETFEWAEQNSQLNTVITLLAQVVHTTAQKGAPKGKQKKFKPPKLAWPRTAVDGLKERMRATVADANKAFMDMFVPVPQDEWEREMAEHQAALEAGLPSPVQERALAEARVAEQGADASGVPPPSG